MIYPFEKSIHPDAVSDDYNEHLHRDPPSKMPGTDYLVPCDLKIFAPDDGQLGDYVDGNGTIYAVWINKGATQRWDFLHVKEVKVGRKQWRPVKKGEVIAISGKTGKASGCHVHLTIRDKVKGGFTKFLDPQPIVKNIWNLQNKPKPNTPTPEIEQLRTENAMLKQQKTEADNQIITLENQAIALQNDLEKFKSEVDRVNKENEALKATKQKSSTLEVILEIISRLLRR